MARVRVTSWGYQKCTSGINGCVVSSDGVLKLEFWMIKVVKDVIEDIWW